MQKYVEFQKYLDREVKTDIETEVKDEIDKIIDNETKEKDLEAKAKELLNVSIPLLHDKTKEGFLSVPQNMLEVLLKAKLTYTEFKLFLYIFRRTNGFNGAKKEYFEPKEKRWIKLGKNANRIFIDQISDAIGIGQQNINMYIKKLIAKNMISVLKKIDRQSWLILVNMNWNQWNISEDVRIKPLVKLLEKGKISFT